MFLLETDFASWVLGIVAACVGVGVIATIKQAIDVAVIKQMLKSGEKRFDGIDDRIDEVETKVDGNHDKHEERAKKHSDRIRDLERPPSHPGLKPYGGN